MPFRQLTNMKKRKKSTHNEIIKRMIKDRKFRIALTKKSHFWFFNLYFPEYVEFETANFQKEIFALTEDESIKLLVIMAFRGSAKSTIMTFSYPIWAILGKQQKKFILIICQTQLQARQHMHNLKVELERNKFLKKDLGPFEEPDDEWRAFSLVLPKYNARITAASLDQGIRGVIHKQHRPDLIIYDDLEDLSSVKNRENRDKVEQWFVGDIIPAGSEKTKIVLVGTLLHEDSFLIRIKQKIEEGKMKGVFKRYPLINNKGEILWPGRFKEEEDIETFKKTIGDEVAWQREYLLRIIPDAHQVVHREWIKYYDELPSQEESNEYKYTWTGVDPAISEKSSADFTAMVSAQVHGYEENLKIYILPSSINKRMDFPTTIEQIKKISKTLGKGIPTKVFIESVAYQTSLAQQLEYQNYPVEGAKISGDKTERLSLVTPLIKNSTILFPQQGAEELIGQLVNFRIEKHDDLVDAFTMLILKILENNHHMPTLTWI